MFATNWISKRSIRLTSLCILLWLFALAVPRAKAHDRAEVGDYTIVLGWVDEPVLLGERNAIFFEVMDSAGNPVEGLLATIDVEILYGPSSFLANITAGEEVGTYVMDIIPTVRGVYNVHITGAIGTQPVDVTLSADEVLPANILQFPETPPDALLLEQQLTALEETVTEQGDQLQRANWFALSGVLVGLIGLLTGIIANIKARKKA